MTCPRIITLNNLKSGICIKIIELSYIPLFRELDVLLQLEKTNSYYAPTLRYLEIVLNLLWLVAGSNNLGSFNWKKKDLIGIRRREMKLNWRKIETWNWIGNKGREWIPDWAVISGWKKRGISATWLGFSISENGGYRKQHPSPFLLSPFQHLLHKYSLTPKNGFRWRGVE